MPKKTYSTAIANCFITDSGGMSPALAAAKLSTVGIASAAYDIKPIYH